jgi:predicted ATPase
LWGRIRCAAARRRKPPELLRLRRELEAVSGNLEAADADLVTSVELAEQQGALSWRLRAEMSLARLRIRQPVQHPLEQLAKTYARFSEGFETADLRAARSMLNKPAA